MRILGISGSGRPEGNTTYAVQYALKVASEAGAEIKFLSVANRKIAPCLGCWNCAKTGKCIHQDDMGEIEAAMRWCDGILIGSPVYLGMVSGQLKMMMDRCVVLRPSYQQPFAMAGKIGGAIACGGFRNGGQELTLQNIHTFLLQLHIMVISDGPGYSHSGAAIAGEAKDDALGLETVANLTNNLVKLLIR